MIIFLGTFQSAGVIQRAYELNARDYAFIAAAGGIIFTITLFTLFYFE